MPPGSGPAAEAQGASRARGTARRLLGYPSRPHEAELLQALQAKRTGLQEMPELRRPLEQRDQEAQEEREEVGSARSGMLGIFMPRAVAGRVAQRSTHPITPGKSASSLSSSRAP